MRCQRQSNRSFVILMLVLYNTNDWSALCPESLLPFSFRLTFVFELNSLVLCYLWISVIVVTLLFFIFLLSSLFVELVCKRRLSLSLVALTKFPCTIIEIVWMGLYMFCFYFLISFETSSSLFIWFLWLCGAWRPEGTNFLYLTNT